MDREKTLKKINRILLMEAGDSWSSKFNIHSETFNNFLDNLSQEVLEFELDLINNGKDIDLSTVRKTINSMKRGVEVIRKKLVSIARKEGI